MLYAQDTVRITMPEAIQLAAARNIDLLRAENALRSAQTRIETARGAFQPTLSVSAGPSVRYQLGNQSNTAGGNSDNASGSFSMGLSSGYTLYNGNADRASLAQAEQLAQASDISINRTAQTTALAVIASFYEIATQRELIAVERENLEAERGQLERVRAFTDAGTRPISDLYTEEATIAAAELRLLQAERDFEVAKLNLVQTLRLDPLRAYDFPVPEAATPGLPLPADVGALVQQAMAGRADVAAQQARIEAAKKGIDIADAGDAPVVSVSGSLGSSYSTTNDNNGFTSQLFSQNPSASVGLSLSLPIFDRNRTDAAVAQAEIEYQNEVLTMTALRQQVAIEVQQARLDLNTSIAQLDAAGRQLAASTQALDVEQTRYESGVSTLTELALARARYVSAQGQVVQARNTVELRRQQLTNAIGGIQAPRATPQPPEE
jgi:outer membrane protein